MRIGFDFDGVICLTPFGRLAVHAPQPVDPLPSDYEKLYREDPSENVLRNIVEYARFGWRRIDKDAPAVVRTLAEQHQLFVVTGRSALGAVVLRRWMRRNRISDCFADISMAPPGLTSPQHKLAAARMFSLDAHIDDDPRTAYHLAQETQMRVYLLDHAGARGEAPLPPRLTVVRSLDDFARRLTEASATST